MEEVNKGISWNKKRIFITIFLLALLIIGGLYFRIRILADKPELQVKGVNTQDIIKDEAENFSTNVQESIKERVEILKREVSGLDIIEIASSSPQIQKIINDVKALEQYPTNQLKEICRKICGL